ncbi:hypothetical protein [Sporosarcina sp. G11-34]|uniref:hypothetical protein n=1 Tax=Sporosarcina sp. G11-34 TaxID=2849605 RepID=UPI0022A96049|nr:hypothetical protein [Sporosarcina sp. G11-34]MCZ2259529.1 hypothetical protein [Sporosarcina sp. G11-34]
MGFAKTVPSHPLAIHRTLNNWSPIKKLVFVALMAALGAIFQAAGTLLPGIGYMISPLATAPILLGALLSLSSGISTYVLTICLLLLMAPSELLIFPFTTGLIGIGFGWTLRVCNRRFDILLVNGFLLFIGICIPLYVLGFPVFGPVVSSSFSPIILLFIFGFSLLYSWLWMEFGLFLLRKIKVILSLG